MFRSGASALALTLIFAALAFTFAGVFAFAVMLVGGASALALTFVLTATIILAFDLTAAFSLTGI